MSGWPLKDSDSQSDASLWVSIGVLWKTGIMSPSSHSTARDFCFKNELKQFLLGTQTYWLLHHREVETLILNLWSKILSERDLRRAHDSKAFFQPQPFHIFLSDCYFAWYMCLDQSQSCNLFSISIVVFALVMCRHSCR